MKLFKLFCRQTTGFCVRDDAPQLEDEVIREPEGLEVGMVDGFSKLHRVGTRLGQFPDLRGWNSKLMLVP